jgi:uncharacterized delta-60 repeat protein
MNMVIYERLEPRRFLSAGQLDPTFGGDGEINIPRLTDSSTLGSVVEQSDGKILLVGSTFGGNNTQTLRLQRFNNDGTLDPTFGGGDGVIDHTIGGPFTGKPVIDPVSGKFAIYWGGISVFNADGSLDTSFSAPTLPPFSGWNMAWQNGKIITGTTQYVVDVGNDPLYDSQDRLIVLRRFNSNGSLDTTFGDNGLLKIDLGVLRDTSPRAPWLQEERRLERLLVAADGSIILGSNFSYIHGVENSAVHSGTDLQIIRLTPDGEFDTSFSEDGVYTFFTIAETDNDKPFNSAGVVDMVFAANGDVVPLWYITENAGDYSYFVARVTPGAGNAGLFSITVPTPYLTQASISVDSEQRYVIAGMKQPSSVIPDARFFAQRYNAVGELDYTYASNGTFESAANHFGDLNGATLATSDGHAVFAGLASPASNISYLVDRLQNGMGAPPTIVHNTAGSLIVNTSDNAEQISLYIRGRDGRLIVRVDDFAQSFAPSRVRRIALWAHGGNDIVTIGVGVKPPYIDGGEGNDTLNGGPGGDVLLGDAGADEIYGNDGDDILLGGGGDDYLLGGAGKDDLFGNGGHDLLSGAGGNDRLFGGPDDSDAIRGGAGNDSAAKDEKDTYDAVEMLLA